MIDEAYTWRSRSSAFRAHARSRLEYLLEEGMASKELEAVFWKQATSGFLPMLKDDDTLMMRVTRFADDMEEARYRVHEWAVDIVSQYH